MSPVDPLAGFPNPNPDLARAQEIADLKRQVRDLQRGGFNSANFGYTATPYNLATGASADIGPQVTLNVSASGLVFMTCNVEMQAGGGPLAVTLIEDGSAFGGQVLLATSGGPEFRMPVPGLSGGVVLGGLDWPGGGVVVFSGRTPGSHTYSLFGLQAGPGPGTGTFTNRALWVWTLA